MRIASRWAHIPPDQGLCEAVDAAGVRLYRKLCALDPGRLDLSEYSRYRLEEYATELRLALNVSASVLCWGLYGHRKPWAGITLADYGGGCGLLTFHARELGVGRVVYNDIYDVSCRDASRIGRALGLEADRYVTGEIADVANALASDGLACDAVVSNNVIEHIYDVEGFLLSLARLSEGPFTLALASDANARNPRLRRILMSRQREMEHRGRTAGKGDKPRDCAESYYRVRRGMISDYAPDISAGALDELARRTRGRRGADIRMAVDLYRARGEWPPEPAHPTNTCDPHTGNWTEQLLDQDRLCRVLADEGFEADIVPGCYGRLRKPVLRAASWIVNPMIRLIGRRGIRLAPFYIVHGRRGL